jgi:pimeloyl-ACP methyl ester carboxylesterase
MEIKLMSQKPVRKTFKTKDNVTLGYTDEGQGQTIIFVHGTAAAANRWQNVAEQFLKTHRVIQYDRRGRGQSSDSDTYTLENEVDDLLALVYDLGNDAVINIVAHSFGALVTLAALNKHPLLCRRLVLYEAPLAIPQKCEFIDMELVSELERVLIDDGNEAATIFFQRKFPRTTEKEIEELKQLESWPGRIAAAHTIARELRVAHDYSPDLDALMKCKTPGLILLGGASHEAFEISANTLQAYLPNSKLEVLPDERHRAMDTVPELLFRIVANHLNE